MPALDGGSELLGDYVFSNNEFQIVVPVAGLPGRSGLLSRAEEARNILHRGVSHECNTFLSMWEVVQM